MARANIEIVLSSGAKAGETLKELTQSANRLNREIKDLKPGSEAFINKTKDFQKVTGRLGEVRSQVKGVATEQKALNGQIAQFLPFGGQLQSVTGKMGMFKSSIGNVTKGFGVLKTAIAATGIGLLVVLFTSLVGWFSKTQRGIELLSKASAGLSAAFDVIVDRGSKMIDALKSFLSLDFKGGLEKSKEAVSGLTDEIARETKQAYMLKAALIEIDKSEDDLILKRSASRAQIKELNKLAEDTSKGYAERSDAAKQAIAIEQNLLKEQIDNQKQRAANVLGLFELTDEKLADIRKNGLKLEDVGLSESTEADRKKAIEEISKIFELQESSLELQTTLQNKLNTINQQRDAADKKRIEEKKKREADLEKFLADQQAQEIEQAKATDEAIAKSGEDSAKELKAQFDEVNNAREAYYKGQLELLNDNTEEKRLKIEEDNANRIINEQETQDQILQLEHDRLEKQLGLLTQFYGKDSVQAHKAEIALRENNLAIQKQETDEFVAAETRKQASLKQSLALGGDVAGAFVELLSKDEKARKKHAGEIKAFQAAQTVINGIAEVQGIFASTSEWGPVGWVLGGVQAAIAIARTAASLAQINSQKFSLGGMIKYGVGGVLKGPRHSQGGIPAVVRGSGQTVELEGGEIILTRGVGLHPAGLAAASNLNAMYGGVRFMESGGPVNPVTPNLQGAPGNGSLGQMPGSDPGVQFDRLLAAFTGFKNEITGWQRNLQVNNNVQDTQKGINVINGLKRRADF